MSTRDHYRPTSALDWCAVVLVPVLVAIGLLLALLALSALGGIIARGFSSTC